MIYVFDLDGTLCPIGKPVSEKTVAGLRELEERGHSVALCSGKPTYYLCGMARQLGLSHPILIGENGGVIQLGVHLPPEHFYIVTNRKKTLSFFREKRAELAEKYGDLVWFQPNEAMLTVFPRDLSLFDALEEDLSPARALGCKIYRFVDCFDVVPDDVDKGKGLAFLAELTGCTPADFTAVGDGENDYPMFAFARYSVGISLKDKSRARVNVSSIDEALDHLLKEDTE